MNQNSQSRVENQDRFNRGLLDFIQGAPTPFHAVLRMAEALEAAGFTRLNEADAWDVRPLGRYYVTRNDSALIAFCRGDGELHEKGLRMIGAHTDSPCLKIKPEPEINQQSFLQLGVEVYGGALLNPWFDRDLSIAGRVSFTDAGGGISSTLIDFRKPVAFIPSLAIHFDREANKSKSVNAQTDMPPILLQVRGASPVDFRRLLLDRTRIEHPRLNIGELLDYDLYLYDVQPPAIVGLNDDFMTGARFDNLMSCYTGLRGLIAGNYETPALLVCNDHEEVGSATTSGAQGPFLEAVLSRLCPNTEERLRLIDRSVMISADDAHGLHPNYMAKYDANHGPILNHGPVIKVNASQRYATNSETAALFRALCASANVPVQTFVMRSDLACGSTIGPLTATRIGVRTVDVGIPIFAMHSIRESAGVKDAFYLYKALERWLVVRA